MALCAENGEKSVRDRVISLIRKQFSLGEGVDVEEDNNLVNDFGADSLDSVEFAMELSEEFDFSMPSDDDIETFITVKDVITYVEKRLSQAN